jgi:hypothetical protein
MTYNECDCNPSHPPPFSLQILSVSPLTSAWVTGDRLFPLLVVVVNDFCIEHNRIEVCTILPASGS